MFAPESAKDEQVQQELDDVKAQSQAQLEEINNMRFELEELKAKYLPKHIAILAEHEDVRPAMVIASDTSCVAYNTYGEPLLITDSLCYMMNESPSMIPKSRQVKQVSTTAPSSGTIGSGREGTTNIDYFDGQKDFLTAS